MGAAVGQRERRQPAELDGGQRLEAQAKVWHDLLFGSRSPDSYLLASDHRRMALLALGITGVFALAVILGVWFFALTMTNAGRSVTAQMAGLPREIGSAQSPFVGDMLDWQKWSTLLATLSSLVVLLTGLIGNVSGWILYIYRRLNGWLKLQFIYHRTYRR